jgi:chemotaxis protein MotB
MAGQNDKKYIIKKIIKKKAHGSHGGAWKIAYADFVTAMMSFFLIMWLINSLSLEQKKGIADYFAPTITIIDKKPSGEGMLAGKNAMGAGMTDMTGTLSDEIEGSDPQKVPPMNSEKVITGENIGGKKDNKVGETEKKNKLEADLSKQLLELQQQIKKQIESNQNIKALSEQIEFSITSEGLNINITDRGNKSMFPPGSSEMYDYMRTILEEVTKVIKNAPNQISITGHTDAIPYTNNQKYSNWELSADRANAIRRTLEDSGLSKEKIEYVRGSGAKNLLNKNDPTASENRRITVTLLK